MDYDEYVNLAQQAAQLDEAGEYEQALNIFRGLPSRDISDLDKAMMSYNIGLMQEKRGREQEALASYEGGMSYERPHGREFSRGAEGRIFVLDGKAGRESESV